MAAQPIAILPEAEAEVLWAQRVTAIHSDANCHARMFTHLKKRSYGVGYTLTPI